MMGTHGRPQDEFVVGRHRHRRGRSVGGGVPPPPPPLGGAGGGGWWCSAGKGGGPAGRAPARGDRGGGLVMTSDQVSTVHAGSAGVVVPRPEIMDSGYGRPPDRRKRIRFGCLRLCTHR